MDTKQEWIAKIAVFSLFVLLFQWSFSSAQDAIKLDWSFEDSSPDGVINFISIQSGENELKFDITAQNTEERVYSCLFVTAGNKTVHIDDEMGEYPGIRVKFFRGAHNKFAPKQRKRISLYIPMPSSGTESVNIHFGFNFRVVSSNKSCKEPLIDDGEYNFHINDWNISFIRN